jgi:O-antigen/teichoic acid export membrane protein
VSSVKLREISDFIRKATRTSYFKHSALNSAGLLMAALVPVATAPILARVFTPEEFGVFGLFLAVSGILTVIAAGRYEVAIVIPKEKAKGLETALAAMSVSLGFVCFLYLVLFVLRARIKDWIGLDESKLFYAPLAALVGVNYQIMLNCAIRERLFVSIGIARITAACFAALAMIVLGLLELGAWGLILGAIVGQVAGLLVLLWSVLRQYRDVFGHVSQRGAKEQLVRFRDYPKFALVSDLANTLALRMPIIVFSSAFGAAATGYLTMFQRAWAASSFIGTGIGETFRQKAAQEYASHGNFIRTYRATFAVMAALAIGLWLLLTLLGPWLFELLLGAQWREAGVYARILATLVCIQFVASPLGWTVYIVERLRYNMIWQWSLLALYSLVLYTGTRTGDESLTLVLLSAAGAIMYSIYIVMSHHLSKGAKSTTTGQA